MRSLSLVAVPVALALASCASAPAPYAPSISIVNSLSFDHAISGKRDGLRSAWPVDKLAGATEHFPLAQVKQCDATGACKWGVLDAHRRFGAVSAVPGGVKVAVDVIVNVARSQSAERMNLDAAMTIPADVAALDTRRAEKQTLLLEFGKVKRLDFGMGITYELCAQRLDAARQHLDKCDVAYH